MIAKLAVWDSMREAAIRRMLRTLKDYVIVGVKTTIAFCEIVLGSEDFNRGKYSTHFIQENWSKVGIDRTVPGTMLAILEAMKMENEMRVPQDAEVTDVLVNAGDVVEKDQVIPVL
jgi:acetyl/propionyl-CoA carboxylase alpha subunit